MSTSKADEVKPRAYRRHRFRKRYTGADIELLAEVDEAHETLSGPATQKILQRELHEFRDAAVSTAGAALGGAVVPAAEEPGRTANAGWPISRPDPRRWPSENGASPTRKAGPDTCAWTRCIKEIWTESRVLYHINAVDEVTQWQVVGATAQISEAWLMPVLEAMLEQFPFHIRGFHSDNGSEFINHTVAELLNKLLVEQTKSRPRHSNDNGLAETKNGWVIRKHMGYGHIASAHAEAFDEFYREHFNPYLNFHRPCGVPEVTATRQRQTEASLSMVCDCSGPHFLDRKTTLS